MTVIENAKQAAARRAVEYIQDGMVIGLGSGSTSTYAVKLVAERMRNERIKISAVPTSCGTNDLAAQLGIPLIDLLHVGTIDLTIDGADEVDDKLNLIKGHGGALVREKLVAVASKELVIICDDAKLCSVLGNFPLPVTVVPFAWRTTQDRLLEICADLALRLNSDGSGPYLSDDGLYILDLKMKTIPDPATIEMQIKSLTGVVDVGLFVNLTTRVVVGHSDGTTEILSIK